MWAGFEWILAGIEWDKGTISVIGAMALPIIGVIAFYWHKTAKALSENELKRSMVERGMSVDEIERVLGKRDHE